MDPNQKNQAGQATSHVIVPAPSSPQQATENVAPVNQNPIPEAGPAPVQADPQQSINDALKEQAPNMYANWTPPQHQSAFEEMNSPLPQHQNGEPGFPHQLPPKKEPGRYSKKIAMGFLAILALVGLPATIYLTQQQQTVQQHASTPAENPQVVERFMNQDITKADLQAIAEEQYAPGSVDTQALKDALDTKLERMVLDKEASDKDIQVSDSEIQAKEDNDGLSQLQARYAVLKDKVTEMEVKNWKVYSIGYWTPDNSDTTMTSDEKALRDQIALQGPTIINDAKIKLEGGESAFSAAKDLLSKYPNFKGQLAVNGFQISSDSTSTPDYENSILVTHDTSLDSFPFYQTIYGLTGDDVNKVKINNPGDGSGEDAIYLVSFNNSSFDTYQDWLTSKESTKKLINPL